MDGQRKENELIKSVWAEFDRENTGFLQPYQIQPFLEGLAKRHSGGLALTKLFQDVNSVSWLHDQTLTEPLALSALDESLLVEENIPPPNTESTEAVNLKDPFRAIACETPQAAEEAILAILAHYFHDVKPVDWITSLHFMSKFYEFKQHQTGHAEASVEELDDAMYYAKIAHGVYGWRYVSVMHLHASSFWKGAVGDVDTDKAINMEIFLRHTNFKPEQVLHVNWEAGHFSPAHIVVIDHERKNLVVCIRGTLSAPDAISDAICAYVDFQDGKCHQGMLECARNKIAEIKGTVLNTLEKYPEYLLVFTGHSLGGGACTIMALIWKEVFPDIAIRCWSYGCPCNVSKDISEASAPYITTVICRNDLIPRLSFGSLYDLKDKLQFILKRTSISVRIGLGSLPAVRKQVKDLGITQEALATLKVNDKLQPPGRILYLSGSTQTKEPYKVEVADASTFDEIPLMSSCLTDHWPGAYEKHITNAKERLLEELRQAAHKHTFQLTFFKKPTWCTRCKEFITQVFTKTGYECTDSKCDYKIHKSCLAVLDTSIYSVLPEK